jgi:DNA-binding transcriptional ArsR family regulator
MKDLLVLNLKEHKSKKLAQVISSDTCRRVMDALSEKEYTASELAKNLNIPLSTIHYNLEQLVSSGLVIADEFHYSKKGKEILHYKLASKYIVITSRPSFEITEKLKAFLPAILIMMLLATGLHFYPFASENKSAGMLRVADEVSMVAYVENDLVSSSDVYVEPSNSKAIWFLIGSIASLLVLLLSLLVLDYFKRS